MDCFQRRKQFLYDFKEHLNFVFLTANPSVSDYLIKQTPDLPWNLDESGKRLPVSKEYKAKVLSAHTPQDQDRWNYIEALMNPSWTWDFKPDLYKSVNDPRWPDFCGRWFFPNWCRNGVIMKIDLKLVQESLCKYVAATKIQRTFRRCISDPSHPMCRRRLAREFEELQ